MKRRLLLANLVLIALSVAAAVHLRREWMDANARQQAILQRKVKPGAPPPMTPLPPAESVKAAGYSEIAQKTLFSKDRNPTVVIEPPAPPPPKPVPALPLFHGLVDLGEGPMAIMSEGPKAPHRDYRPGEQVGPFTLVAIDSEEIVLEWEGHTITKKVDEMFDRTPPAAPAQSGPVAAAPHKPAQPPPPAQPVPGADLGRGIRACQAGDTSPSGTVADGMRKVIKGTPFGKSCYWESANSPGN